MQEIAVGVRFLFEVSAHPPVEQVRPDVLEERVVLLPAPQGPRVYERLLIARSVADSDSVERWNPSPSQWKS